MSWIFTLILNKKNEVESFDTPIIVFILWILWINIKASALEKFKGAHKAKNWEVMSPAWEKLNVRKNIYWAPKTVPWVSQTTGNLLGNSLAS